MPSITRYFFSVSFTLLAVCFGYSQSKDSTVVKVIKPKKDFRPTGIRIGTDLIDLAKTGKTFKGWELNGDIDLSNYYLTVDIGSWAKDVTLSNGEYTNGGTYFRIGADVNLLGNDPDKNMFFFGFRVGRSLFHESLTYAATSPYYPTATYTLSNGSVSGGWAELTTGLRVKVWKGLWMGYTARMKFAPGTKGNSSTLIPYDMPGYGIVSAKPWWGFNYQAFWRFAWRKDKPIVKR